MYSRSTVGASRGARLLFGRAYAVLFCVITCMGCCGAAQVVDRHVFLWLFLWPERSDNESEWACSLPARGRIAAATACPDPWSGVDASSSRVTLLRPAEGETQVSPNFFPAPPPHLVGKQQQKRARLQRLRPLTGPGTMASSGPTRTSALWGNAGQGSSRWCGAARKHCMRLLGQR